MKSIKYIIYREGKYYVSQSLNVDVSSFGVTIEEAKNNLKEALDLYFEDEKSRKKFIQIKETLIGELSIQM
jgi:predicted RNase H-like HicB family nuclease